MIPCANPDEGCRRRREAILAAVARVVDRGQYILGEEVASFETAFAAYCGVEHAVGVASGTDALTLALRALGITQGDEVITVSHTALATVAAILATGATPVLVDVEPDYWTLDPAQLAPAVTQHTKAIVAVHLYGQPAALDAVTSFAREYGLFVVEDCAQAAGARHGTRRVGSIGDVGCFSFYPTKNLGAIGDGGLVVTHDARLAERVRRLRQYGWDDHRATEEPGLNSRLDEMQAAILNVGLADLDADNDRRRAIASLYDRQLAGLPLRLPRERPGATHVYHLYVVAADGRETLRQSLARDGIVAGVHYPLPVHRHRGYAERCRVPAGGLPITDRLIAGVLSLPMYPDLTIEQALKVAAAMQSHLSAV